MPGSPADVVPLAPDAPLPPPKPGAAPASGTLVVQTMPPAHEGWKAYSEAVGATTGLLWVVVVVLAIVLFKKHVARLLEVFGNRIADPGSSFKLGPLELQRITVLESQVASQAESNHVDRQVLVAGTQIRAEGATDSNAESRLRELANLYRNVNIKAWAERVRRKDEIAAQMASLVVECRLSREALARDPDESIRMALATTINTLPLPDDPRWIQLAAPGIQLKHVRYRFMMAIARLVQVGYLKQIEAQEFIRLAEQYRENADDSLLERIERTRVLLKTVARQAG
jgi:hypothetical protein